jgi:uncharacterized DUF497 family protein
MPRFEWDPGKETRNAEKHGIDFTTASQIWSSPIYERTDDRQDYGEPRIIAYGVAEGRVLAVVYTPRGQRYRIISARRASARERTLYEAEITRRGQLGPD